jgi:pimeloyl-ACP methyl ester carboxylesterase
MLNLREDWTGRARSILAPALVLHGADDPILPLANGEALAATIPGARLVVLRDLGHALPSARLPEIVGHIAGFLDAIPVGPA